MGRGFLGSGVWVLDVETSGFGGFEGTVWRFGVQGSGFRVQGFGFGVWGREGFHVKMWASGARPGFRGKG